MATQKEYSDSLKARGLTDAQAKAQSDAQVTREQAAADRDADIAVRTAAKKTEHDRCWAMRHTPGQPPKGLPVYNATLNRWERP
jgi:hypothetical protein